MPENEFLRRKREHEFQRRVLAAIEKPKRNRFFVIINSAAFIWLASVFVITIGGGYITNHKQCMDDAEKIIERRSHLSLEMRGREGAYLTRVSDAKTIQDASTFPDKRGSIYTDLSATAYPEVRVEYLLLTRRVRYAEIHDPNMPMEISAWGHFQTVHNKKRDEEFEASSPDKKSRALKFQKLIAELLFTQQSYERTLDNFAYIFVPDCSVLNTAATALGYRPPIVFGAPSPLLAQYREIIYSAHREVDRAQSDLRSFVAEPPPE
jgi:hypothetical protein